MAESKGKKGKGAEAAENTEKLSRSAYLAAAQTDKPVIRVGDQALEVTPKHFSEGKGSVGMMVHGKVTLNIGGKLVKHQFTGNLVAVKSAPDKGDWED